MAQVTSKERICVRAKRERFEQLMWLYANWVSGEAMFQIHGLYF